MPTVFSLDLCPLQDWGSVCHKIWSYPKGWLKPASQMLPFFPKWSLFAFIPLHFFPHPPLAGYCISQLQGSSCALQPCGCHLLEHANDTDCLSQSRLVVIAGFGCFLSPLQLLNLSPAIWGVLSVSPSELLWLRFLSLSFTFSVSRIRFKILLTERPVISVCII